MVLEPDFKVTSPVPVLLAPLIPTLQVLYLYFPLFRIARSDFFIS